jgi:hypothetical protein
MATKVVTPEGMVAEFLRHCSSDSVRLQKLANLRAKHPYVDCEYLMWDFIA